MKNFVLLTLAGGLLVLAGGSASQAAQGGEVAFNEIAEREVLDNDKLIELIKGNMSLKVITNRIESNKTDCSFVYDNKAMLELQKACEGAKWVQADIDTMQLLVSKLSQKTLTDLRAGVYIFMGTAENLSAVDERETDQNYQEQLHRLMLKGRVVVPFLLDQLITQESDRKRVALMHALQKINEKNPMILKQCILMLDDPRSPPVRAQAAKTVAALAGPATGDDLIQMLEHRESVADGVAMALGFMRYQKGIEPLVQLLKTSRDGDDRIAAAFALGWMRARTQGSTEALLEAILDERNEKLRTTAAHAAAEIGIADTPSYIIQAFNRFRQGRREIIDSLKYFKSVDAANFLADKLEDDDSQIRKIAMETLEVMTGDKHDSKEDWKAFIETLAIRPAWQPKKQGAGALPDVNNPKP